MEEANGRPVLSLFSYCNTEFSGRIAFTIPLDCELVSHVEMSVCARAGQSLPPGYLYITQ